MPRDYSGSTFGDSRYATFFSSVVCRYYRAKFSKNLTAQVGEPFVFWTKMYNSGDGHLAGNTLDDHGRHFLGTWNPFTAQTPYLKKFSSTGTRTKKAMKRQEMCDSQPFRPARDLIALLFSDWLWASKHEPVRLAGGILPASTC
jgi:hypothetical protein